MLFELINNRMSVRKYLDKNIPDADLKKVMMAGYLAPSWMNSQPWKFILVKNQETKDLLSTLAMNQPHVKSANAVIVCVADKNGWGKEKFGEVLMQRGMTKEGVEKIFNIPMLYPPLLGDDKVLMRTVEQVTYAVSFMILQAKELNIDSCVIGAISSEATVRKENIENEVKEKLNLKDGEIIITMLTLGYNEEENPIEFDKTENRKNIDEILHFEKIGNKFNL